MPSESTGLPAHAAIPRAIVAACGGAPSAFVRFAEESCGGGLEPSFTEHSVRFGDRLEPFRLTHYFDVGRDGASVLGAAFARLGTLAEELGHAGASDLVAIAPSLEGSVERIEQVVLGIDARNEVVATRLKLYLVFSAPAPEAVERLSAGLGRPLAPAFPASEVRLIGVDVSRDGISDRKAYLRLDPHRLARTIREPGAWQDLAHASREVVLQHGLGGSGRRQLHFHASDEALFARWLSERAETPGIAALLAHVHALDAALSSLRMAPWIIGLPYEDGRVDVTRGNVYLHPMPR